MQQKTKLGINFGFRGWMLLIFEVTAFLLFQAFTNFPMNMLADFYGGAQLLSTLYTVGTLVGIVIQLILSGFIGKIKSVKTLTLVVGIITLLAALGVMVVPAGSFWLVCYFLVNVFSIIYGMFGIGIIIGQWFPTRKGVFMGIATFAFPICNGLMGPFAGVAFNGAYMAASHGLPNVFGAFLPFLIVGVVGWLIGLIFIKDYPEQVGCYRDNDKSFTKEKADAMLAAEIENKKTSVWKTGNALKSAQFWLVTIPMGTLLMCAVGMMTQTSRIIGSYPGLDFGTVMGMVMIFALIGSYVLGLIDGKFGTKTAITVSVIVMLLSGILGGIGNQSTTMISIILLAIFMGAGSNFTVSAAAQYWRREDFPSVFAVVNPIANIIQSLGPMMVAMTIGISVTVPFWVVAVIAVIALILILCFKPEKVKATDDKYRAAAGKPLDDALVGRK
ncbi:MAG: MFS transporter [Firmicutes bacterium]|nr:MFS transporter [Bacillota bacterium]